MTNVYSSVNSGSCLCAGGSQNRGETADIRDDWTAAGTQTNRRLVPAGEQDTSASERTGDFIIVVGIADQEDFFGRDGDFFKEGPAGIEFGVCKAIRQAGDLRELSLQLTCRDHDAQDADFGGGEDG